MLPSLAALESHLQSEHAKEPATGHALRPHSSEAGSPYGAKVSVKHSILDKS